jgi:pimeloyl-ACP methyl ester carboxylesterase
LAGFSVGTHDQRKLMAASLWRIRPGLDSFGCIPAPRFLAAKEAAAIFDRRNGKDALMAEPVDYAFLHGGGQGSWVWEETIAALKAQAGGSLGRVLALDVPGCGTKRGRPTDGIGIDEIADELIADIGRAGMRDVVLVGHSQGGNVLPAMAERRPGLFRRLVHISCSLPRSGQTVQQMIGSGVHGSNPDEVGWPVDPATTAMRDRYRLMFCNDMAEGDADAFLAKLGHDAWPMRSYTETRWTFPNMGAVASSYVVCLRDLSLPVPWQEIFAERFKATRRVSIDAGHQAMNTRPQALAEILRHETLA